jgi:hypothetical protein
MFNVIDESVPNVPQQQMAGMMSQNSGQVPQGMMQAGHPHSNYNIGGMQQQQQQQGAGYNSMQFQQTQQQAPQQFNQQNFNQYNSQQTVYNPNMVSTPSQKQGHINPNPMMSPTHTNQFGSPPSGMMRQGQVMYQYNAAAAQPGPRLPNPAQQQQIKMAQMQGWNQNTQMFNPQQQQAQSKQQPQQQYIPQHQSKANIQGIRMQVPFSAAQSGQNQTLYMQRMSSPGIQVNRMPTVNASQPNSMGMSQQMYSHGNQNFNTLNMPHANTPTSMSNDPMIMQQPQQYIHQQQTTQQFPQQQQQQQYQYQQPMQQQSMTDNCVNTPQQQQQNILRFPQTSPTLPNVQQRLPFNNMNNMNTMSQPRANVPMLSPRPTPPPQSPSLTSGMLSPTGSTSSHQGGFNSMEPSPNHPQSQQNNSNMFQPSAELNDKHNFGQFNNQNMNQIQSQTVNQTNGPNSNMHVSVNTNTNNLQNQSQCSPVKKVVSPSSSVTSPSNTSMDIQSLNQQIQQLYSMPQTPQTQQKILDLQEKVQMLKSQQLQQSPRPSPQQQQFQSPTGLQGISQPLPSPKQAQSAIVSKFFFQI